MRGLIIGLGMALAGAFGAGPTRAQGVEERLPGPVPDSLRAPLAATRPGTVAHTAVLVRIAHACAENVDTAAVAWSELAEREARRLHAPDLLVRARNARGAYYVEAGYLRPGARALHAAEAALRPDAPAALRAATWFGLGYLYTNLRQEGPAARYYRRAGRLYAQLGDSAQLGEVCNDLGLLHLYQSRPDSATLYLLRALRIHQRLGNEAAAAATHSNLGLLYGQLNRFAEAAAHLRRGLAVHYARADTVSVAATLNYLSGVMLSRDSAQAALRYQRQVVGLVRRTQPANAGTAYGVLAAIYYQVGKPDSGLYYDQQGLRLLEELVGAASPEAAAQRASLARNLARLGRWPAADIQAGRALATPGFTDLNQRIGALRVRYEAALHRTDSVAALRWLVRLRETERRQAALELDRQLEEVRVGYQVDEIRQRAALADEQRRAATARAVAQQARAARLVGVATALALGLLVAGALVALVARSRRRLAASEAALRRADATKDRLMSIIGHDLRGPVANFQQAMPLVRYYADHPDPPEQAALADDLTRRAQQLGALLDNLLHWSRAQRDEVRNHPEAVAVTDALTTTARLYEPLAKAKGVQLRVEASPGLLPAWADPALLTTVLRNLTANAVKFTPAGGHVALAAEAAPTGIRFTVRDTGVGMPPEQVARLFDVTATRSTAGTAGEGGTGLGLLVCHHFVHLLGGELAVCSGVDEGTAFSFTVPVQVVAVVDRR